MAKQTTQQRVEKLEYLYDTLLASWVEHAEEGIYKGSLAISYQLERVRQELKSLTTDHTIIDRRADPWGYTAWGDGLPEASDTVN